MLAFSGPEYLRRLRLCALASLVGCGWLFASAPLRGADDASGRTFTDTSGQFEIKATFVKEENGTVTLKQTDGDIVEIELDKLSAADQDFIKAQKSKAPNPFKKKANVPASPFRSRPAVGAPMPEEHPDADGTAILPIDWSAARIVQIGDQSRWGEIHIQPAEETRLRPMGLPKKRDFFEKLTGFVSGPQFAAIGYKLAPPGKSDVSTRLLVADLKAGKGIAAATVDGDLALLDLSPAGELALLRKDVFGFGNQDAIEIWKVSAAGAGRQAQCSPFAAEDGGNKDVKWGAFLDESRVAVLGGSGQFGVIDIRSGRADYTLTVSNQSAIALSGDRKYIAIASGQDVQVLDADEGAILGIISTEPRPFPGLAFSPDGQRLCLQGGERLTAWNLADGSTYREVVLSGLPMNANIPPVWTSPENVLVGGSYLINLENDIRLWTITGADAVTSGGTQTLLCLSPHNAQGAVIPLKLPHESAQKLLEKALADPSFFVVAPGASVQIDVSAIPDASQQQSAREGLAKQLIASGMKVSDNAPLTLRGSVENTGSENMRYHTFGAFGEESISVTKWVSKVILQVNNQTVWETQALALPHFLTQSKDESLEQAVRKANQPNYGFFASVGIPAHVMRPLPMNQQTLGQSAVTPNGLR